MIRDTFLRQLKMLTKSFSELVIKRQAVTQWLLGRPKCLAAFVQIPKKYIYVRLL